MQYVSSRSVCIFFTTQRQSFCSCNFNVRLKSKGNNKSPAHMHYVKDAYIRSYLFFCFSTHVKI